MSNRVAVIGAGSWGTTVASLAAENAPTRLWARDSEIAREINAHHRNSPYLTGFDLSPRLEASDRLTHVLDGADVVVMGVPSHGFRAVLREVATDIGSEVPVVSLTKGFEQDSGRRMTEVVADVLPGHEVGVLTGPNLAKEILAGHAAASVLAMRDDALAGRLQQTFSTGRFRVYASRDVIGCELGGALKNVFAIAVGMAEGLGTGDNTRAAVITRGLAELTRLGVALGGQAPTFAGLAGMGDLVATCISDQSRNRYVGEQLGRGRSLDDITDEMDQVAEGVKSASVVHRLAALHNVYMPIASGVHEVLTGASRPAEAYERLLGRQAGRE